MPKRVRERMVTYAIALKPSMLAECRQAAAEDDIALRLWFREAIALGLKAQKLQRERREAAEREQLSA